MECSTPGTERTSGPAEAFIPSAHPAEPPQSLLLATPIQFKAAGATFDALKVLEPIQSGGSEKVRLVGRVALDPPPEPSPSSSAPGLHTHSTPLGRSSSRHQALGERGHPPLRRTRHRLTQPPCLIDTPPGTQNQSFIASTDPQTDVARGLPLSRHLRSRYRCSMCSAVRMVSRILLRSSSIYEPSDPPSKVMISFFPLHFYRGY